MLYQMQSKVRIKHRSFLKIIYPLALNHVVATSNCSGRALGFPKNMSYCSSVRISCSYCGSIFRSVPSFCKLGGVSFVVLGTGTVVSMIHKYQQQ